MEDFKLTLDILTQLVTIIGLPFAIAVFYIEKRKERKADEDTTFHQLDESYTAYQTLCLQHPDLDIFDPPIGAAYQPTAEQLRREHAIFGILISLFERAFIMFKDQSSDYREAQWNGWVEYIKSYAYRENFQREWLKIGHQFDAGFIQFMNNLITLKPKA